MVEYSEHCTDLRALAERYVRDIRVVQPDGPYARGGLIAYEMAQQLQQAARLLHGADAYLWALLALLVEVLSTCEEQAVDDPR